MAPGGRAFTRGDELVSVLAERGVDKENFVLVAHLAAATKAVADKYKFLLAEVKPRYFMSFYNTTIKYDTVVCMQLELEPDKWRVVQEIKLHFANDFDYASDDEYVPMSKGHSAHSKPYFFKHGGKVVDLMEIYLKQIFNDSDVMLCDHHLVRISLQEKPVGEHDINQKTLRNRRVVYAGASYGKMNTNSDNVDRLLEECEEMVADARSVLKGTASPC